MESQSATYLIPVKIPKSRAPARGWEKPHWWRNVIWRGAALVTSEVPKPIAAFIYFYFIISRFSTEKWEGSRSPCQKIRCTQAPPLPPSIYKKPICLLVAETPSHPRFPVPVNVLLFLGRLGRTPCLQERRPGLLSWDTFPQYLWHLLWVHLPEDVFLQWLDQNCHRMNSSC